MSEIPNLILSPSRINNTVCWRLVLFSDVLEYEPINKAHYLETGDLFHKFLEHHYLLKKETKELQVEKVLELGLNHAAKNLSISQEDTTKVVKLYKEYANHYRFEEWIPLEVEQAFSKILFEDETIRIIMEGKIDLIAQINSRKEEKIVIDHKMVSSDREQFDRDNQKLCYAWATGIREFVINQCGTQSSYNVDKRLTRKYFSYTKYQIEDWVSETVDLGKEMYERLINKRFPGRYNACVKFGKCTFYDVCNSPNDNWAYKLKSEFRKKTHNLFPKEENNG